MEIKNKTQADKAKADCKKMGTRAALVSAIGGAIPLPGVDVIADIGVLLKVLPRISKRFGLTKEQIEELDDQERLLVFNIIKKIGARFVGQVITKEILGTLIKRMGLKIATRQIAVSAVL